MAADALQLGEELHGRAANRAIRRSRPRRYSTSPQLRAQAPKLRSSSAPRSPSWRRHQCVQHQPRNLGFSGARSRRSATSSSQKTPGALHPRRTRRRSRRDQTSQSPTTRAPRPRNSPEPHSSPSGTAFISIRNRMHLRPGLCLRLRTEDGVEQLFSAARQGPHESLAGVSPAGHANTMSFH
jgi:hypothetical protein